MADYHLLQDSDDEGLIFYALIAKGQVILCEHSISAGNFSSITRVVLSKLSEQQENVDVEATKVRKTYMYDSYMFHYLVEHNITYLCLAEKATWHAASFVFLESVASKFKSAIEAKAVDTRSSVPLSMNDTFSDVLRIEIEKFNSNIRREGKRNDMVKKVKKNLEDAKAVVVENIEKILERGEKINLLVDKTDRMQHTAHVFETSARNLHNAMWWDNLKRRILLFGLVLFVIFFLLASFCGGLSFEECRSEEDHKDKHHDKGLLAH